MNENLYNSELIRGSIDAIILSILCVSDNYGYKIIKEVNLKSEGDFELKEPTLYSSLRRLEGQKMIISFWGEETQGGRRKYYSITDTGRALYQKSYKEWQAAKIIIDRLIEIKA